MGVDIQTYRARIGTYRHSNGVDVVTLVLVVNFSHGMKTIGSVLFIGLLLVMAGIEQNPGPKKYEVSKLHSDDPENASDIMATEMETEAGCCWFFCKKCTGKTGSKVNMFTFSKLIEEDEQKSTMQPIPTSKPTATNVEERSIEYNTEASNNSDNEGTQQVPSPAVQELHQSTPSVVKTSHAQSKEEENFLRLTLLILKCGMPLLRCFISYKAQENGEDIDAILRRNKSKILRQLHKELKETVFPQNGKTDIELCDFSTITVVLLVAFKSSLIEDERAAIRTIKHIRDNVFAHSKTLLLRDDCYEGHSSDMKQAIETLLNKLDISEQDRFKTILNECVNGPIGEKQSIIQTIESQFQQLRADMKKIIRDEYKTLMTEGKVMKEPKVVGTDITISGGNKDKQMVELVQKTILDIFKTAIKRSGTSEFSSLKNAVQGIVDGIDGMENVKVIGAISGSIILEIEVTTNKALLDTLDYIEGESMNKKLETVTNELKKKRLIEPACSLSAAVSQDTLWALSNECTSQREDYKSQLEISPTTTSSPHLSESSASEKENPLPEQHEDDLKTTNKDTEDLIDLLGIKEYLLKSEMTVNDVLMTDPSQHTEKKSHSMKDLPWLFLKQILAGNSDAFDLRIYNLDSDTNDMIPKGSVLAMYESNYEIDSVSPLDIFLLVFQCCDPELKQLLFQKLYLCKKAVPFVYKRCFTSEPIMSLWPLYSIVIENKTKHPSGNFTTIESEVLDMPTKFVTFARFGRPQFSKSKLLNGLLCDYAMDIFFHKDCQSGMIPRLVTDGYIEMFWLPKIGESVFDDPITFLNVRGNIESSVNEYAFISTMSDVVSIFVDLDSLLSKSKELRNILVRFPFVLLVIASPINLKDYKLRKSLLEFEDSITNGSTSINILCTHTGEREKNPVDIVSEIKKQILIHLKEHGKSAKPLQICLTDTISSDENECSQTAKALATSVVKSMKKASNQEYMASNIAPVQCRYSTKLGEHLRKICLNKDINLVEKCKQDITSLRLQQLSEVTESVRLFINCMEKCSHSKNSLHYFLGWLKLFLGRNKREVLSTLLQENQRLWEDYRKMKKYGKPTTSELIDKEKLIKQSESRIENASFGIEHLLREVGHIYDAIVVLKLNPEKYNIPKVDTVANIFAMLVLKGLTFELLDGNSFYMPGQWIQLVFGIVHERIGKAKVLALSALGLQSSGKSTLLNTMFGVQFSSSAGRCTRGIHSRLIPMRKQMKQNETPLFEYVLVIDTEGLRAPELSNRNYNRDNELATIITGLGDITMLNIMGENTTEIRDIFQIIVHAFLRLKLANHRLDIRKSCILIHQNVADISASEKMKIGLELTMRNLDSVTRESAESEGISDITTFDQIIEFNTDRNVWYLPNLWKGNPPMAQINRKYSEKVVSINHELLDRALRDQSKSFKSLHDIVMHTGELWKGVLAEDFVFSFKNSIEKKAYVALEQIRKDKFRSVESEVDTELFRISQNQFSACKTQESLEQAKHAIVLQMKKLISSLEDKVKGELEKFFTKNEYTDITIQWKEKTINMLRELCTDMAQRKLADIERMRKKRAVDILTSSSQGAHEEKFRNKSIELADFIRGKNMEDTDIKKKFEDIWNSFVEDSFKEENLLTQDFLKQNFVNCLSDLFDNHSFLYQVLEECKMFKKTAPFIVSGSFHLTTINKNDISIKSKIKEVTNKYSLGKLFDNSLETVKERLANFFKDVDVKLEQFCKNDIEITDREVRSFISDILCTLKEHMEQKSDNFTLIISFNIKTIVHVSRIACYRFEELNKEYQKLHGLQVRLTLYKKQCEERFYAHLNERNVESTGAALFRHVVENFIRETVKDGISNQVKNALKCKKLPKTKYDLIIEMLIEIVRKKNFSKFIKYIKTPKTYATNWITSQSNSYLFDADLKKYFEIASLEVNLCLEDIETGIRYATNHFENSSTSIDAWMDYFHDKLNRYKIPIDDFRDVKREFGQLQNLDAGNFKSMLKEELSPVKDILLNEFAAVTEKNVKWRGSNPYNDVMSDIWGCPEQCVFCGEPCSEGSVHSGSNHKCLQHRPKGCNGIHIEGERTIVLTTCNYDVTQSTTASCSCFRYRCNPGANEECHLKKHSLSEYRKLIPDWDIKGICDAEERSKFWLWFIGKYKKELADHYNIVVSNVPSSWSNFSEEDAIESLRKTYPE